MTESLLRLFQIFDKKTFFVSLIFSIIWIVGSDHLVNSFFTQEEAQSLQTFKGLLYVFILSLIVSVLKKREIVYRDELFAHKKQAMLGEFSGMIVHEVRNPLHTISLALSRLESQPGPVDKKTVSIFNNALGNLNETLDFLQALARGESKDVKKSEQNLKEIIERVISFYQKNGRFKSYQVHIDIPKNITIKGSKGLLFHLFLNLIKNAIESFETQSDDNWLRVEAKEEGGSIVVSLSNSGKAISLLDQAKLFTHFTSKEESKGTGLGLLICKQIMKGHEGSISYDKEHPNPKFDLIFQA